jgi:hypothetical protein
MLRERQELQNQIHVLNKKLEIMEASLASQASIKHDLGE